jgi:hypothetical protein
MPDDLTLHYHRLTHSAALVGEFDDRPERQTELLAWVLEAVRAIAAARGLALETGPEPLPPHLSRDLWPAQPSPALFDESEDPDLSGCAEDGPEWVPHFRTIIEAGAGFAPGELAQGAAEDGAERVMQAAESWWGAEGMSGFKIPSPAELERHITAEEQSILSDLADTAMRAPSERWRPGSSVWIAVPSGFYGRVELRFKEIMWAAGWLVVVRSDQRDGDALEISAL